MGTWSVCKLEDGCEYGLFIQLLNLAKCSKSDSVATVERLEKKQNLNKLVNISLN